MSQDQLITCPKCDSEFELTASLAGPIIEQERRKFEEQVRAAAKEANAARTEALEAQAKLEREHANIEAEIAARITARQKDLGAEIRKQVIEEQKVSADALNDRVQELLTKLQDSQTAEAMALKAQQEAEEKARTADLEIAKQVGARMAEVRETATVQAEEGMRLKIAELEKQLTDTSAKLDEAKRKAEQGSQQLQGEVLELDLETSLNQGFPWDEIVEVKKGQRGGDWVQRILAAPGVTCGSILWETKRAQNWSGDWADKAKQDAREAKAEAAVIVSEVLPKGISNFGLYEGVWVTKPLFALPVAQLLRNGLVETALARKATAGKESKADLLYDYMTGPEFFTRLQGIAEPFVQMQRDLQKEKSTTIVRWNKREKQMERVLHAAMGMRGDLQGLGGADMHDLECLELAAISAVDDDEMVQ